jgi:hypothetical protein
LKEALPSKNNDMIRMIVSKIKTLEEAQRDIPPGLSIDQWVQKWRRLIEE